MNLQKSGFGLVEEHKVLVLVFGWCQGLKLAGSGKMSSTFKWESSSNAAKRG